MHLRFSAECLNIKAVIMKVMNTNCSSVGKLNRIITLKSKECQNNSFIIFGNKM